MSTGRVLLLGDNMRDERWSTFTYYGSIAVTNTIKKPLLLNMSANRHCEVTEVISNDCCIKKTQRISNNPDTEQSYGIKLSKRAN